MKSCIQIVTRQIRNTATLLAIAALAGICVAGGASVAAESDHQHMGGYHHPFSQADVWAKEFDDPSRDAWQKPDQVLDALNLDKA